MRQVLPKPTPAILSTWLKGFGTIFAVCFCLVLQSCLWDGTDKDADYLTLDDSEYPYADLPRLVIETEDFRDIRDVETDINARMQIYGKTSPESSIQTLTIKGHGNSSFKSMPKYSLKIKMDDKTSLLGMPKDNEWILVSNFSDKTQLKNFAIFKLAQILRAPHVPRSTFVELYLNREYMGIYLLTESIKVGKTRVNIPQNDSSYLFEKTTDYHLNGYVIRTDRNTTFRIRYPKQPSEDVANVLLSHLNDWEKRLYGGKYALDASTSWIDIQDYIRYYWLLEFSKNHDGKFGRSIFFTWQKGGPIKMGPVWDYDETFGCTRDGLPKDTPQGWLPRQYGWNNQLFKDSLTWEAAKKYWKDHRDQFAAFADSIDSYAKKIKAAIPNETRRWNALENTEFWAFKESYRTYDEGLDSLKSWARQRIEWIDGNIDK